MLDGLIRAAVDEGLLTAESKLRERLPATSTLVGVALIILIALGMLGYAM